MARLPLATRDQVAEKEKSAYDAFMASRANRPNIGPYSLLAHMPEVAQLCRRLWFDTSAGPFLYEPTAYRAFVDFVGADRLLFGSDYPLLRADPYRNAFAAAGLSGSEQRAVLGDNAAALLRLSM